MNRNVQIVVDEIALKIINCNFAAFSGGGSVDKRKCVKMVLQIDEG